MKIVLTGGGTGGHAYPAICIAKELRAQYPDCSLLYIGGRDSIEERLASAEGIPFEGLVTRKIKKTLSADSLLVMSALARGFSGALSVLMKFKPDLVIGTGGYASAAVVLAQSVRMGKTLVHEQNVIPGRTNLFVSRFATKICVTFDDSYKCFPKEKTVVTGLPVRPELLHLPDRIESRLSLGIQPDIFTILVYGGSQGAKKFNQIIAESIPALKQMPVQILHQVGERNFDESEQIRKDAGWDRYHVYPYFDDMRPIFSATDFMLSRCGASTIAEITAIGIPALLVPYPYAYADHQWYNGDVVAKNGGGILVREQDFTPQKFIDTIEQLTASPDDLIKMREASVKLGRPDAAGEIASIAAQLAANRG